MTNRNDPAGDPYARAKAKLDEEATPLSWQWERDGEEVVGIFLGYDEVELEGSRHRVLVLRTRDGQRRSVWLFQRVLRDKLAEKAPGPGQMVAIRRYPQRESMANPGQRYWPFEVVVVDGDDDAAATPTPAEDGKGVQGDFERLPF